ncbi:hypothetical protein DIPPA_28676 [Diplonema papillatum]|nr:hypothetical protein DIPPA_28676 [Diplonema papillatum]
MTPCTRVQEGQRERSARMRAAKQSILRMLPYAGHAHHRCSAVSGTRSSQSGQSRPRARGALSLLEVTSSKASADAVRSSSPPEEGPEDPSAEEEEEAGDAAEPSPITVQSPKFLPITV